jgi:hypothetical protein
MKYKTIKFKREFLMGEKGLGLPYYAEEGVVISDNIVDNDRWTIQHEIIFKYDNKFYRTWYQVGATEIQDEDPWEWDKEIECFEVQPVLKTIEVYESIKVDDV